MEKKEAIVLKNLDYLESSKIVYIYTNQGKDSFLIKGAQRPKSKFRSVSEPISKIEYLTTKGNLKTLTDASIISFYNEVKNSLETQAYALHMLELVYTLCEDVRHDKVYLLLSKCLEKIESGFSPELISFIFELKMLFFLGFGLDFTHFTNVDTNTKKEIEILYRVILDELEIKSLEKQKANIIRKIINALYSDFLGYRTNTLKLINQIYKY